MSRAAFGSLARRQHIGGASCEASGCLEHLNRVARRVFGDDLFSANTADDVVAEVDACLIEATTASMSLTSKTNRFHPPGSGTRPSSMGLVADVFAPLIHRVRSSFAIIANSPALKCNSKPRCWV